MNLALYKHKLPHRTHAVLDNWELNCVKMIIQVKATCCFYIKMIKINRNFERDEVNSMCIFSLRINNLFFSLSISYVPGD